VDGFSQAWFSENLRVDDNEESKELAKIAKSERLDPYSDLALLGQVSERLGLDPDIIYNKPFNFVMNFVVMWREQEAYGRRLQEANKAIKNDTRNTGSES
jgi:hypothetical protein